jgi:hypothetical protein
VNSRIAAFTLVWAYVACWLWFSLATDGNESTTLLFFPPGYFFLTGVLLGIAFENLANLRSRLWVLGLAFGLSLEMGVWLHAGHLVGLRLGLVLAVATLAAGPLAPVLCRRRAVIEVGTALGTLIVIGWILSSCFGTERVGKVRISPDGAFLAWASNEPTHAVHIGPRYAFWGAFERRIEPRYTVITDVWETHYTEVYELEWLGPRSLRFYGLGVEDLPGPTPLIPIKCTWSVRQSLPSNLPR